MITSARGKPIKEIEIGYKVGDYTLKEFLGDGSTSKVFKARNLDSGLNVAIKVAKEKHLENILKEARILTQVNSRKVIKLKSKPIVQDGHIFLILEYCNRETLVEYARNMFDHGKYISFKGIRKISKDITEALQDMHKHNIAHRDIKLENILITRELGGKAEYKLGDLGSADLLTELSRMNIGTHGYQAPEVFERKPHGKAVDIWSFGLLLYKLVYYVDAFEYENYIRDVLKGKCRLPVSRQVPKEFVDLLKGCLRYRAKDRLSIDEVMQHPFFASGTFILNTLVEFDIRET